MKKMKLTLSRLAALSVIGFALTSCGDKEEQNGKGSANGSTSVASSTTPGATTPGATTPGATTAAAGLTQDQVEKIAGEVVADKTKGLSTIAAVKEDAAFKALEAGLAGWTAASADVTALTAKKQALLDLETKLAPKADVLAAFGGEFADSNAVKKFAKPDADTLVPYLSSLLVNDTIVLADLAALRNATGLVRAAVETGVFKGIVRSYTNVTPAVANASNTAAALADVFAKCGALAINDFIVYNGRVLKVVAAVPNGTTTVAAALQPIHTDGSFGTTARLALGA